MRSTARGVEVEVLNVLGAGDAFSAGFLSGWVRGEDYDACARYANACGALVVSRHGCAPAMPTRVELDYFLANADRIPRPDHDATLTRLHRVTAPRTPHDEVLRLRIRSSQPVLRARRSRPAPTKRDCRSSRACSSRRSRRRRAALGLAGRHRRAVRRPLRSGRAERRDRTRLVDRPPGRAAGIESARRSITAARSARTLIEWPHEHVVKCLVQYHPGRRARRTGSNRRRRFARCTTRCRRAATSCCSRSCRRTSCRARPIRYCAR